MGRHAGKNQFTKQPLRFVRKSTLDSQTAGSGGKVSIHRRKTEKDFGIIHFFPTLERFNIGRISAGAPESLNSQFFIFSNPFFLLNYRTRTVAEVLLKYKKVKLTLICPPQRLGTRRKQKTGSQKRFSLPQESEKGRRQSSTLGAEEMGYSSRNLLCFSAKPMKVERFGTDSCQGTVVILPALLLQRPREFTSQQVLLSRLMQRFIQLLSAKHGRNAFTQNS